MKAGLWGLRCWNKISKIFFATLGSQHWHFSAKFSQIWQKNKIYTTFFSVLKFEGSPFHKCSEINGIFDLRHIWWS